MKLEDVIHSLRHGRGAFGKSLEGPSQNIGIAVLLFDFRVQVSYDHHHFS